MDKHKILRGINNWVNRNIQYASDKEVWGKIDYWPTTREMKEIRREDCDGQAIAKYGLLKEVGFPLEELALVIGMVMDATGRFSSMHMVCCWYENEDDPWVLDNGALGYGDDIWKGSQIANFKPLVAFNEEKVWEFDQSG